ncbi:hypothetical protein ACSQ67_010569 [Phaseolus vulgaris]
MSISDGDIGNCNSHLLNNVIGEDSTKLCDLGKQIGLACRGDEEEAESELKPQKEQATDPLGPWRTTKKSLYAPQWTTLYYSSGGKWAQRNSSFSDLRFAESETTGINIII